MDAIGLIFRLMAKLVWPSKYRWAIVTMSGAVCDDGGSPLVFNSKASAKRRLATDCLRRHYEQGYGEPVTIRLLSDHELYDWALCADGKVHWKPATQLRGRAVLMSLHREFSVSRALA
jgi:hypothetical protein